MRLRLEPFDGSMVEIAYRNGFIAGLPRNADPAIPDWLIETALRLWLRKRRLRQDVAKLVARYALRTG